MVHYFRNSGRLCVQGALPSITASGLGSEEAGGSAYLKELLDADLTPSPRGVALRSPSVGAGECLSTGLLFKYIYIPR